MNLFRGLRFVVPMTSISFNSLEESAWMSPCLSEREIMLLAALKADLTCRRVRFSSTLTLPYLEIRLYF